MDKHLPECECSSYSDMHKDVYGYRPRGDNKSCADVLNWFYEHYEFDAEKNLWDWKPWVKDMMGE